MNIEEYIASGILESYVLGQTSDSENALISCLMQTNPRVQEEVKSIEAMFEKLAFDTAIEAPAAIKQNLLSQLSFSDEVNTPEIPKTETTLRIEKSEEPTQQKAKRNWLSVAASLLLILSLGGTTLYLLNQNKALVAVLSDNKVTKDSLKDQNKTQKDYLAFLTHNKTMRIELKGVPKKESMAAVVFWNTQNKHVMLSDMNLPKVAENKEYQLWAIVDGKPVDAGMIDLSEPLIEMKEIENSQAFAITMEPKGGSASPHLEDLCVIGEISR